MCNTESSLRILAEKTRLHSYSKISSISLIKVFNKVYCDLHYVYTTNLVRDAFSVLSISDLLA